MMNNEVSVTILPTASDRNRDGNECLYCANPIAAQEIAAAVQVMRATGDCYSYYHAHCLAQFEARLHAVVGPLCDTMLTVAPLDVAQLPVVDVPAAAAAASVRLLHLKGNVVNEARLRELLGYGWATYDAGYHLAELLTAERWSDDELQVLVEGWGLYERLSRQ